MARVRARCLQNKLLGAGLGRKELTLGARTKIFLVSAGLQESEIVGICAIRAQEQKAAETVFLSLADAVPRSRVYVCFKVLSG